MVFKSHPAIEKHLLEAPMLCTRPNCRGNLIPANLLEDQSETHRHRYNMKLVGFTDPNGFKCDSKQCGTCYTKDEHGNLYELTFRVGYDYDLREIVVVWVSDIPALIQSMIDLEKEQVETEEFQYSMRRLFVETERWRAYHTD